MKDVHIKFKAEGINYQFDILTNMSDKDLYCALDNWLLRTETFTGHSFAHYVNQKPTDHKIVIRDSALMMNLVFN